jgi:regulator of replication initiation timing
LKNKNKNKNKKQKNKKNPKTKKQQQIATYFQEKVSIHHLASREPKQEHCLGCLGLHYR